MLKRKMQCKSKSGEAVVKCLQDKHFLIKSQMSVDIHLLYVNSYQISVVTFYIGLHFIHEIYICMKWFQRKY